MAVYSCIFFPSHCMYQVPFREELPEGEKPPLAQARHFSCPGESNQRSYLHQFFFRNAPFTSSMQDTCGFPNFRLSWLYITAQARQATYQLYFPLRVTPLFTTTNHHLLSINCSQRRAILVQSCSCARDCFGMLSMSFFLSPNARCDENVIFSY